MSEKLLSFFQLPRRLLFSCYFQDKSSAIGVSDRVTEMELTSPNDEKRRRQSANELSKA